MKIFRSYFLFVIFLLAACQSPEPERKVKARPPGFLAVRIWGEETGETVNCLLQVQRPGTNSAMQKLDPEESVSLDNIRLEPDSARYSGIFYEASFPLQSFGGQHQISFTSADGRTHSNSFEFYSFSIPDFSEMPRTRMEFRLNGFPEEMKKVNLLITDTAYATNDLNTIVEVRGGTIRVDQSLLKNLKSGPVVMQVILEDSKELKLGKTRGRLQVSYGVTREFVLL